ncbi:unnamed protein product [Rotaria sordida]|uniref:DNA-directed RNA polymerase n=1 Tax=Rotaria sordida TaxID=392033 RepID=A0A819VK87_9BILA|nr:unnamed protein product [Rotaria sordida]
MKSCPSKSNARNIDLMSNRDVIIRHGHILSGLIDKAHCGSTLVSVVHCYYELYGKRCAADHVLLLSPGVSHRCRLINQCRAQAGQKSLQKTFSLPENSNEQILINEFAKGFCSKSFDEHDGKKYKVNPLLPNGEANTAKEKANRNDEKEYDDDDDDNNNNNEENETDDEETMQDNQDEND